MDGVLVDNRDIHLEAFRIFARRYGIAVTDGQLMPLFGMGNEDIIPAILPAEVVAGRGVDALADEKETVYREIYAARIEPNRGLLDFIDLLDSLGIRKAVGSSGQKANVDFVLDRCGISERFDAVVNGDMVAAAKPAPDIFLRAAGDMGLDPASCVVIEDSFAGLLAARRAGMKAIAMATTFPAERLASESDNDMIVPDFTAIDRAALEAL